MNDAVNDKPFFSPTCPDCGAPFVTVWDVPPYRDLFDGRWEIRFVLRTGCGHGRDVAATGQLEIDPLLRSTLSLSDMWAVDR